MNRTLDILLSRPVQLLLLGLAFLICHLVLPGEARAQLAGLWIAGSGQALEVVRHDVRVTINHPVAETVVTQEFKNPHAFNVETYFHYPVPPGASVTGMALWVNGERREARMLERQKAREIYNGIVAEKRDPALLERLDGNVFRIRIFPVLARSRQRVELRFAQPVEMPAPGRYRYTLKHNAGRHVHTLRLGVTLRAPLALRAVCLEGHPRQLQRRGGAHVLPFGAEKHDFKKEIILRYAAATPGPNLASQVHGDRRLFVAELPLDAGGRVPRKVAVLLDTSRSMARHRDVALATVRRLLGRLGSTDRAAVIPFNLLPLHPTGLRSPEPASTARTLERLAARPWTMGTAFAPAVRQALAAGARHLVLVTDGGTRGHQAELEHLLRVLYDRPGVTVSVVAMAGAQNQAELAELATATGGIFGRLESRAKVGALAVRLARLRGAAGVSLTGAGKLRVLRREPGRLLVTGQVPATARWLQLQVTGAPAVTQVEIPSANTAAVRGLWAAATIHTVMRRIKLFGEEEKLRLEVVKLSKTHNVLSEYTALLATETDADYKRKTSGRKWQRKVKQVGDDLPAPSFDSTPEPHEWALMGIALLVLLALGRRAKGRHGRRGPWGGEEVGT